jgi:hypothetical protein
MWSYGMFHSDKLFAITTVYTFNSKIIKKIKKLKVKISLLQAMEAHTVARG